jgi:hypothetical protein
MKKVFFYILLIAATWLLGGCAGYNVMRVTNNNKQKLQKKQGLYYNLPQTLLKINITVKQTVRTKGPLAEYAEKYLGIKDYVKQNSVNYEIMNVNIIPVAQRDPAQYYFVNKYGCIGRKKPLCISVNDEGFIQSLNCFPEKHLTKTITDINSGNETIIKKESSFLISANTSEKFDTIIEHTSTDTMSIEKRTFKKIMVAKPNDEKAKEYASFLMKIKETRFNLITGASEVNYAKDAIKYMIDQLDKTEQEYISQYTGDSTISLINYSFTYLPDKKDITKESTLCIFSPNKGIIKNTESGGEIISIVVNNTATLDSLKKFQSKIDKYPSNKNGFFYCIPEYAKVSIHKGKSIIKESDILINQFGVKSHMPRKTRKLMFNTNNGSVKTMFAR